MDGRRAARPPRVLGPARRGRWKFAQASGTATPIGLDDELVDIINDAAIPAWRIVDPRRLGALVVTAAEDVDALIAAIPAESVDAVLAEGRPRLLDRSRHRELHLATIEAPPQRLRAGRQIERMFYSSAWPSTIGRSPAGRR